MMLSFLKTLPQFEVYGIDGNNMWTIGKRKKYVVIYDLSNNIWALEHEGNDFLMMFRRN